MNGVGLGLFLSHLFKRAELSHADNHAAINYRELYYCEKLSLHLLCNANIFREKDVAAKYELLSSK